MTETGLSTALNDESESKGVPDPAPPAPLADERPDSETPASLNRLRKGFIAVILVACLAIAVKPTYDWWVNRRSEQYRAACEAAASTDSWEQLEAAAAQWVNWDPTASEGWIHLADAQLKLGNVEEAVDSLNRIDDDYPSAIQALVIRGDILFSDLNLPYAALENWERMLRINSRADFARQRLIYFYAMTMQRDRMISEIRRAMELGTEPPEAYAYLLLAYEVTFSDGLRMTRNWLESYPDDETLNVAAAVYQAKFSPDNTLHIFGTREFAGGDFTLINEYFEKYPQNLEVLSFHIEQAIFEGDEQRTRELLQRCPAAAELDPRFWRYRGWYLATMERNADADEALARCLELNPYDWRARILREGVLRELNQPEEAARQSRLGVMGKDLHQFLFELPTARDWDTELANKIRIYSEAVGDELTASSLAKRLGFFDQPGLTTP